MKLVSINVAKPRSLEFKGEEIKTGIFKTPVNTPVAIGLEGLSGDVQVDKVHHGGPDMAVYAYGLNHYPYWQHWLNAEQALNCGAMGENLSFSMLDENQLGIGDVFAIGDTVLAVSQFRVPCFKLGAKFKRDGMPHAFTQYAHTGAYFKVLETGTVNPGDAINVVDKNHHNVSLKALFEAWFKPKTHSDTALLERAVQIDALSSEWRQKITARLARL